jgi:hypothetical protein
MLRSGDWLVVTDVSEQLFGPIFKGQTSLDFLVLEVGTDRFFRNVAI